MKVGVFTSLGKKNKFEISEIDSSNLMDIGSNFIFCKNPILEQILIKILGKETKLDV